MIAGLITKLVISLLMGAVIGLERESGPKNEWAIGGIRTFSLIGLLGALCGLLYTNNLMFFCILSAVMFGAFVIAYYAIGAYHSKEMGITSELAVLFTFLIGLLTIVEIIPLSILVALFVVVVLLLSLKSKTRALAAGVSRLELDSFVSYAIIALVVMPFLPNVAYTVMDIPFVSAIIHNFNFQLGSFGTLELINPQKIWLVVVLITGIDVFAYILGKIIGSQKSFTLTSFVAGFISSTSATQLLAQKSKRTGLAHYFVGAALISNMASFLQIFLLVGPLNIRWLISLLPSLMGMIISAIVLAFFFLRKKEPHEKAPDSEVSGKIFSLLPALKFAGLLVVVKIVTKVSLLWFGQSGFIISSVLASLVGLDAVLINLAELAGTTITFKFATLTFLLVNATNLGSKTLYSSLQGGKKFARYFLASAAVIVLSSFIGLLFL